METDSSDAGVTDVSVLFSFTDLLKKSFLDGLILKLYGCSKSLQLQLKILGRKS